MDQLNKPSPLVYLLCHCKLSNEDALAHHGILGQKWGTRNGPPYPLSSSDHSASEKKAGWQKSLDKSTKNSKDSQGGYSSANIGGNGPVGLVISMYAGVALATLVASALSSAPRSKKVKKLVEKLQNEKLTDLNKAERISSDNVNPLNGTLNCGSCCMTEELRLRGWSVAAKDTISGMTPVKMMEYFKKVPKGNSVQLSSESVIPGDGKKTKERIAAELQSVYPEGARGCLYVPMWFGNHYITWENSNGQIQFRNPQNSRINLEDCFSNMVSSGTAGADTVGLWSIRWDNLEFKNDSLGDFVYGVKDSLKETYRDQYAQMDRQQYKELQKKKMDGG